MLIKGDSSIVCICDCRREVCVDVPLSCAGGGLIVGSADDSIVVVILDCSFMVMIQLFF